MPKQKYQAGYRTRDSGNGVLEADFPAESIGDKVDYYTDATVEIETSQANIDTITADAGFTPE